MELLERAKTWWETLGLTAREAVIVDNAIARQGKPARNIPCLHGPHTYGSQDFHDCLGTFDEIRWKIEGKLPSSAKKRVAKKYGMPYGPELEAQMYKYLTSLSDTERRALNEEYNKKIDAIAMDSPDWYLEEELWNS